MMEVCVDSVESAINAEKGGALRVELCANLMEGGTTPSVGMLKVIKNSIHIPVYVMVRPRGGDFLYSAEEFAVMLEDICELTKANADGFVFGILNPDGTVDADRCRALLEKARPKPCTFHRAIDMSVDIFGAMDVIIDLGFDRILTSGGDISALEGLPVITEMVQKAGNRIVIMPGGRITERNLGRILAESKAKEFHGSARSSKQSKMISQKSFITMGASLSPSEFIVKVTDEAKVQHFVKLAQ